MAVRPWNTQEIRDLVEILSPRIEGFGFTVWSGAKSQQGNLALSLYFNPLNQEDIRVRTGGLCGYLKGLWGHPMGLKAEYNPFKNLDRDADPVPTPAGRPLGQVRVVEDVLGEGVRGHIEALRQQVEARAAFDREVVRMEREIRDPYEIPRWEDPFAKPKAEKKVPLSKEDCRFKYQFTRPDGGIIMAFIY